MEILLIDKLHAEHTRFLDILNQVKELGVGSPDARAKIIEAKSALLTHLQTEDNELMPILREKGKTNVELEIIIKQFGAEMLEITKIVLAFFDKYEKGTDFSDFPKDFGHLYYVLNNRMRQEESYLYPYCVEQ